MQYLYSSFIQEQMTAYEAHHRLKRRASKGMREEELDQRREREAEGGSIQETEGPLK
jgi:hypothetical protein